MAVRAKKYICPEDGCGKAYNRPALLRQHERTHSNERPFVCPREDCNSAFFRKSHLQTHELSHLADEDKPYKCVVCGKGYTSSQRLKRHEVTHTKSFRCTYEGCDKAFYVWQSLKHHVDMVHEKSLTCDHCNRFFQTRSLLNKHKLKHHGDAQPFACGHPGCFSVFYGQRELDAHVKNTHPNLSCSLCGRACVGKDAMDSHMLTHDSGNEHSLLWNCGACAPVVSFPNKEQLTSHYQEVHKEMPPNVFVFEKPSESKEQSLQSMMRDGRLSPDALQNLLDQSSRAEAEDTSGQPEPKRRRARETATPSDDSIFKMVVNSNIKTYKCPHGKCQKTYVRHHAYEKHLEQHRQNVQKADEFLRRLAEEDGENGEPGEAEEKEDDEDSYSDFSDVGDSYTASEAGDESSEERTG